MNESIINVVKEWSGDQNVTKVVTHNGIFHADETMAVAILGLASYSPIELIRTRSPEIISQADIVLDVGGVYNPEKNWYDHHQRDFNAFREDGSKYATAGLVWKHISPELVSPEEAGKVDEMLIKSIDQIDNGDLLANCCSLNQIVSGFNPTWDSREHPDDCFLNAVAVCEQVLINTMEYAQSILKAKARVAKAFDNRVDQNILILRTGGMPWQQHLLELDVEGEVDYVIFSGFDGKWMVQAVPKEIGSFELRKPFPETWAGLSGTELAKVTGVDDAVFCHAKRHIAGAESEASAVSLAWLAGAA